MKKAVFIIGIILITSITGQAQFRFNTGAYIGSVTTKLEGDRFSSFSEYSFSIYSNYQFGLTSDFFLKKDVAISFMPGYKQIGGIVSEKNEDYDPEDEESIKWFDIAETTIDYITFPIYLRLISDNNHWQFSIGAIYDYAAKIKVTDANTGARLPHSIINYNFSGSLNIGYRFKLFKQQFTFDIIYTQGITNISDDLGKIDEDFLPRMKSATAETRLSWLLCFDSKEAKE